MRSRRRGWQRPRALSARRSRRVSAAETARANGQFAAEVMCLQTATQFGDHSGASRLGELAAIVEGPRAGAAARFGGALAAGDGAALAAVSEDFERMGDLVAAVDAAAHAAMAYRGQGLRGSGLGCSARAEALAQRCGARTAALGEASQPLPLTDREREIVSLIGAGLSNRDVAARLTISVRTVESHIHNAMAKTGTGSRKTSRRCCLDASQPANRSPLAGGLATSATRRIGDIVTRATTAAAGSWIADLTAVRGDAVLQRLPWRGAVGSIGRRSRRCRTRCSRCRSGRSGTRRQAECGS